MDNNKHTPAIPEQMEQVGQQLESWRRSHARRTRLPKTLWASAAGLARQYGLWRTAQALRLDYASLKARVESGRGRKRSKAVAAFVEVAAAVGCCECVVELENRRGGKMRMHLKGIDAMAIAAIGQALWSEKR